MDQSKKAWIITDGKAGDVANCVGVAQALGASFEEKTVSPRPPWVWMMPWGPADPNDLKTALAKPWPDIVIASGRRAVAYCRHLKKAGNGKPFTVFLKDPRCSTSIADLVWVPAHDERTGPNVITTVTAPHRFSAERLQALRDKPDRRIPGFMKPKVAVLLGGDNKQYTFTAEMAEKLGTVLKGLSSLGAFIMVTPSRRTPKRFIASIESALSASPRFIWDGTGDNPYGHMLALADTIFVTADSHNMVSEAAATNAGIYLVEPEGAPGKFKRFHDSLVSQGRMRRIKDQIEVFSAEPIDASSEIARAISKAMDQRR